MNGSDRFWKGIIAGLMLVAIFYMVIALWVALT